MEITFQKICALTIMAGSVFFLIAAFSPVSRVFAIPEAGQKLELIMKERTAWNISQLFFAAGAIVTVIGLGLTGILLKNLPFSGFIYTSVVLIFVGALLWTWHVYFRAMDPAAFTGSDIPVWLFAGYTLLTQAGLVLFGLALLRTGLPDWVGWMMIGSMILFFVLTLIFRDMPPFVYYIITLVTGMMIYRADTLSLVQF